MYVATGYDGVIATSVDAMNWNFITDVSNRHLTMAAAGEEQFLAVSVGNSFMGLVTSTNGEDWTSYTPNNIAPGLVLGSAYFEGKFFLDVILPGRFRSSSFHTVVSTNGYDWTNAREPYPLFYTYEDHFWRDVHTLLTVNGILIEKGPLMATEGPPQQPEYTTDLIDWTSFSLKGDREQESEPVLLAGAYGDGRYVLAGKEFVATGPDLLHLERIDSPVKMERFSSVAAHGELLLALTYSIDGPGLAVSTNGGRRFELATLPSGSGNLLAFPPPVENRNLNSIEFAQDKFVAVGGGGTVIRTTNGYELSRRLSNTSADLRDVTFGDGQWIAVGENGTIIASPDASTFSLRNSGTALTIQSITHGVGRFVAVGPSGLILTSTDGESWIGQGTEEAEDLYGVAFGNGLFVAAGANGIVHVSTNGVDWTTGSIPGATAPANVAYANGRFFTVNGPAYVSLDGLNWSSMALSSHLTYVEDSGGTVWVSGFGAYLAKTVFEDEGGFNVSGALDVNGKMVLSFDAGEGGDFEILSTPSITAEGWQTEEVLLDVNGVVNWIDSDSPGETRFYRVMMR